MAHHAGINLHGPEHAVCRRSYYRRWFWAITVEGRSTTPEQRIGPTHCAAARHTPSLVLQRLLSILLIDPSSCALDFP